MCSPSLICCRACAFAWLACCAAVPGSAWQEDDRPAAFVDDLPIYQSQVEWFFHNRFGNRELSQELADRLRAKMLEQLVDQQLILVQLSDTAYYATSEEVDLEIARIQERVAATGETLKDWLTENRQSMACLKFNVQWQNSWQRYLEATLTDQVLERFFQRHIREFDGTQMEVAHLLLPVDETVESGETENVIARANEIRQQIVAGDLTWEEATRLHSSAPTAARGGNLGWIEYHRPMPPAFSRAAFVLDADGISQPVQTTAGVHLIRCLSVRPGTNNWYDVKKPLEAAAVRELFQLLAGRQRKKAEVRYTGATPRPDPQAGGPVEPASESAGKIP